jgi:hypothetical protein
VNCTTKDVQRSLSLVRRKPVVHQGFSTAERDASVSDSREPDLTNELDTYT